MTTIIREMDDVEKVGVELEKERLELLKEKETDYDYEPFNPRGTNFYKKAYIKREGMISKLQSYNTVVAEYNHSTNKMSVFGWYSQTTARHINAFLEYFGFDTCTKKELENYQN